MPQPPPRGGLPLLSLPALLRLLPQRLATPMAILSAAMMFRQAVSPELPKYFCTTAGSMAASLLLFACSSSLTPKNEGERFWQPRLS